MLKKLSSRVAAVALTLILILSFVACQKTQDPPPISDKPQSVTSDKYELTYYEYVDIELAKQNETVAHWLDISLNDENRNDIGSYIISYADTSGEKNVYTYIVYRTNLECDYSMKFYMNEEEYIVSVEYTPLESNKYTHTLSLIRVVADEEPNDIDLIEDNDYLGAFYTTAHEPIDTFLA